MAKSNKSWWVYGTIFAVWLLYFLYELSVDKNTHPIIVIPGGGLTSGGEVPLHVQLRIDKAVSLFQQFISEGRDPLIITLSGGTPHKPNPIDSDGFPLWEATVSARALLKAGIPKEKVMEEAFSLDTIGNVSILESEPFSSHCLYC